MEYVSDENGLLEVTLTVDMLESLNSTRIAPAYNGATVGPTLRVKPGDTVMVTLVNNLPPPTDVEQELYSYILDPQSLEDNEFNVTIIYNRMDQSGIVYNPPYGFWGQNYMNLHFHGAEVSPSIEETQKFVGGGESKTYTFTIPDDQDPGLEWYHNHIHGTAAYSYLSSLFGFFIVEGTDRDITKAPGIDGATEILMLLSEALVNPDKSVPSFFPISGAFNWNSAANGVLGAETHYTFEQGEKVLFRIASATVEPPISLVIPNHKLIIVAYDGYPLPNGPEEVDVVTLNGGNRVEFLVEFSEPGTFTMTREAWDLIPNSDACLAMLGTPDYPCLSFDVEQVVATITVTPTTAIDTKQNGASLLETIQLPSYSDSPRLTSLAEQEAVDTKVFDQVVGPIAMFENLANDGPPPPPELDFAFGINQRVASPPHFIKDTVVAGTCETWTVTNNFAGSGLEHPIHAHSAPFLVQQIDGVDVEEPYWRDTLSYDANATFHICFDRLQPGDVFPVHCHMPTHMDIGMLTWIQVIAPSSSEDIEGNNETENFSVDGEEDGESSDGESLDGEDGSSASTAFVGKILTMSIFMAHAAVVVLIGW